ncbi:energy transducer TonB [Novosphingobium panipatense]|uniref:Outer membrane transport energization protein TonB n=1 Tax=Novosphingobium panipatense TaxID=428991 RepID=A0ABY1QMX4_9SPHN|nr:energy transducer TonB [Novosphingobium panipatense]SMP75361.1 outer membrane transport energization protein TonB [Novosphingobium panipatense]
MATVAALAPERPDHSPAVPEARLAYGNTAAASDADPVLAGLATERSCYSPARLNLSAVVASAAMLGALVGALATVNVVGKHEQRPHLSVVEVRELDTTPPPPPPEPTRLERPKPAMIETAAPKPMIELPSSGPTQIMTDAPPPPTPAQVTPVRESTMPVAQTPSAPSSGRAASTLEGGDLSSRVLSAKPPVYPVEARRAREQGVVKLLVLVGVDGEVKDIAVASSSGSSRLDTAALKAVRRWRWVPMMSNGLATAVRGYVTIPFVLTKS